jgi:chlorobactene glucosyltransferase
MLIYQIVILLLLAAFVGLVIRNLRDYAPLSARKPARSERVSILVPARNEAQNIAACLQGLLAQDYANLEIIVLDDCSEDDTAERVRRLMERDSRLRLISGQPIPPGWAGKVWACSQLAKEATGEWLLFVDADTRAQPALVGSALAFAQETNAAMVSTFPRQVTVTFWERIALPMVHFLLLTFLPIRQVWESPNPAFAAACGQFELFRRDAYAQIGGHAAIPASFHDGLQLGRRIKAAGLTLRLFDGTELIACRMYQGGSQVWNGFTRNAYEGIGSMGALIGLTVMQGTLFLAPFGFLAAGAFIGASWAWVCAGQVALIYAVRTLLARRFGGLGVVWLHPLAAVTLLAIQWGSWLKSRRKTGIAWKGRAYAGSLAQPSPPVSDLQRDS